MALQNFQAVILHYLGSKTMQLFCTLKNVHKFIFLCNEKYILNGQNNYYQGWRSENLTSQQNATYSRKLVRKNLHNWENCKIWPMNKNIQFAHPIGKFTCQWRVNFCNSPPLAIICRLQYWLWLVVFIIFLSSWIFNFASNIAL